MRAFRAPNLLLRSANGLVPASRSQTRAAPLAARLIAPSPTAHHLTTSRPFTHSSPLAKKKKAPSYPTQDSPGIVSRTSHSAPDTQHESDPDDIPGSKHPKPDPDDPLDFADVASRFRSLAAFHTDMLKKMQHGDRFSSEAIGALMIQPSKKDPTTFPLKELAEIVPRPGGRAVSLLLHDKDYVKPVMSAVQASPDFNQQPQRDPDNELELILKVEPQNKDAIVRKAKDAAQAWREKMRHVTEKRKKVHAKWQKEGLIIPDLKKRADKELQKVQDKEMKAVEQIEQQTIKKLQ